MSCAGSGSLAFYGQPKSDVAMHTIEVNEALMSIQADYEGDGGGEGEGDGEGDGEGQGRDIERVSIQADSSDDSAALRLRNKCQPENSIRY